MADGGAGAALLLPYEREVRVEGCPSARERAASCNFAGSALLSTKLSGNHLDANTSIDEPEISSRSSLATRESPWYAPSCPGPLTWTTSAGAAARAGLCRPGTF